MKIMILGYSGSGKSTLAQQWSERYQLPLLYLDKVHWLPNWQEQNPEQEQRLVSAFMRTHASWIIEGNYFLLSYEERIQQADLIVFFNFSRFHCLWRAYKRYRTYHGKSRPSMNDHCEEKLDFDFVKWILRDGRSKAHKKRYQKAVTYAPEKVIIVKNQRQLNKLYQAYIHI